jgi:hypothetical protein
VHNEYLDFARDFTQDYRLKWKFNERRKWNFSGRREWKFNGRRKWKFNERLKWSLSPGLTKKRRRMLHVDWDSDERRRFESDRKFPIERGNTI